MPIDLAAVNWLYVAVLAVFVFVSTSLANLLSFNHRSTAAVLAALLFAVMFVFWSYYPHEKVPLPTSFTGQRTPVTMAVTPSPPAAPTAPAAPSTPVRPRNPVTDITPPASPAR